MAAVIQQNYWSHTKSVRFDYCATFSYTIWYTRNPWTNALQILLNNELRGQDQRHGYGAYLAEECQGPRGSEGTNEPKLAIMGDLGMSDVEAM